MGALAASMGFSMQAKHQRVKSHGCALIVRLLYLSSPRLLALFSCSGRWVFSKRTDVLFFVTDFKLDGPILSSVFSLLFSLYLFFSHSLSLSSVFLFLTPRHCRFGSSKNDRYMCVQYRGRGSIRIGCLPAGKLSKSWSIKTVGGTEQCLCFLQHESVSHT
jgi:hypothetical protein